MSLARPALLFFVLLLAAGPPARAADLSLGFGYPYLSAKADFKRLAWEARYAAGSGINVYAGRGYWNFHRGPVVTGFTGLEAGYIKFNTLNLKGTGYEASLFIGGEYAVADNIGLLLDFAPTFIFLRHSVYTDVSVAGIEYVANAAVYYRFGGRKPLEAAPGAAEKALLRQLKSGDVAGRRKAAFELGKERSAGALKPLIKVLEEDPEPKVRGVAALALGRFEEEKVSEPLMKALSDGDAYVRASAAKGLAGVKHKPALPALQDMCAADRSREARGAACEAAEKMSGGLAEPPVPSPQKGPKKKPARP